MADEEREREEPHDVLAAEEFVVPAPDPMLQHEPLNVPEDPEDPAGQAPPHDVLAGEEFPIPAAPVKGGGEESARGSGGGVSGEGDIGGEEVPDGSSPGASADGSNGATAGRSKGAAAGVAALLLGLIAFVRRRRGGKSS